MTDNPKNLTRDLLDSVIGRDLARVRELLRQGADINARDREHHETPLMLAVKFAEADMVQLLLDAGAEVDALNEWGRTALFYAQVSSAVSESLLNAGADVHVRDEEGHTILMRKVSESASLAEVEGLLRLGVDRSVRNEDGQTALDLALNLGLVKIVNRLRVTAG